MRWQENIFESHKNEHGVHHIDISWVLTYVQTHKIMYMEYTHLVTYQSYLNKMYFQKINFYIKEIDATK